MSDSAAILFEMALIIVGGWFVVSVAFAVQRAIAKANVAAQSLDHVSDSRSIFVETSAQSKTRGLLAHSNLNSSHLFDVRCRTCYPAMRQTHICLTAAAIMGWSIVFIGWLWNCTNLSQAALACAVYCAVLVALLLEYGIFRMIVDAVDVLIDTGRQKVGDNRSE